MTIPVVHVDLSKPQCVMEAKLGADGLYRFRCTHMGCKNKLRKRPYVPRRVLGPCNGVRGIGDAISWLLALVWINQYTVTRTLQFFRLIEPGKSCGCRKRKDRLNLRGAYLKVRLRKLLTRDKSPTVLVGQL